MSTEFNTYKGLNLPKLGEEVLDFWEKENVFEKSISSREGALLLYFLKGHLLQMVCQVFIMY